MGDTALRKERALSGPRAKVTTGPSAPGWLQPPQYTHHHPLCPQGPQTGLRRDTHTCRLGGPRTCTRVVGRQTWWGISPPLPSITASPTVNQRQRALRRHASRATAAQGARSHRLPSPRSFSGIPATSPDPRTPICDVQRTEALETVRMPAV